MDDDYDSVDHDSIIDDEDDYSEQFSDEDEDEVMHNQDTHDDPGNLIPVSKSQKRRIEEEFDDDLDLPGSSPDKPIGDTDISFTDPHVSMQSSTGQGQVFSVVTETEEFLETLLALFDELPIRTNTNVSEWVQKSLKRLLMYDEHNFLFISALVQKLSTQWNGDKWTGFVYRRILDEIDRLSDKREEVRILADSVRFSENLPIDLVCSLINIRKSGRPTQGDIIKLHRLYSSSSPPPVAYLRNSLILDALVRDTFSSSGSSLEKSPNEKLWLLAYGSHAVSHPHKDTVDLSGVTSTVDSLKNLAGMLVRVTSMSQIPDHIEGFLIAVEDSLLAMVLLFWLREKVFDPDFYAWASMTQGEAPPAFYLLDEIAAQHLSHRGLVFAIYRSLFEHDFEGITPLVAIQFKQKFLDRFLFLLKTGFVSPVLHYLTSRAHSIDNALVVYFLENVLDQVKLPCHPSVVDSFLSLCSVLSPETTRDVIPIKTFLTSAGK